MKNRDFEKFFCSAKEEKLTEKVFRCKMAVSLLTILACTVIMSATTLALFYTDISTDNSTLSGAYYSISVENVENGTYICPLAYNDEHVFEINAIGTATAGHCEIRIDERVYYTGKIEPGVPYLLSVKAARGATVTFSAAWGNYPENAEICENGIVYSETPYSLYTVEQGANLSDIAAHYGITEGDIILFNNLPSDENGMPVLSEGIELRIPNPGETAGTYSVSYAEYVVEPTADIEDISAYYNVPAEEILAFNNVTEISTGMTLRIPNADPAMPAYAVPFATYIIEENATIEGVSEYYGISVEDIIAYNGSAEMVAGNELRIPGTDPITPPYIAPAQ